MFRHQPLLLRRLGTSNTIRFPLAEKKGGVDDLKKALACAIDARDNGVMPKPITKNSIFYRAITNKLYILENNNFSNASKVWEQLRMVYDATDEIIEALEDMIDAAE